MFIDVNETTLFYSKEGEGAPIILLHCNFASHKIFDKLIRQLKSKYTVYAIDSRGHGKSRKHSKYDYQTMSEDIAEFIRALNIEKPIIYGYSDGGILGLLLASKYPALLSKLLVSGANMDMGGQKMSALRLVRFGYFITRDKRLRLILEQPDFPFGMLHNITVPVLIMAGSRDMIKEQHTIKIAHNISNSELKIIVNESHGSYVSHSKKLYGIIRPFLEKSNSYNTD